MNNKIIYFKLLANFLSRVQVNYLSDTSEFLAELYFHKLSMSRLNKVRQLSYLLFKLNFLGNLRQYRFNYFTVNIS